MGGRPWTTAEETYIRESAGKVSVSKVARKLGRTCDSVRSHAASMRRANRLHASMRVLEDAEYISDLEECSECGEMRSTCDADGVCKVCRDRKRLERHMQMAEKAYWNLPKQLRERTTCEYSIERNRKLMRDAGKLRIPEKPDVSGMDAFFAAKAMDDWLVSIEKRELDIIAMDINAAKQRRSKWKRKAKAMREKEGK